MKEPKTKSADRLLCAQGLCPAKQVKPRARSFCLLLLHYATASGKITNALAAALPYIVLPAFTRSFSSDIPVVTNNLVFTRNPKKSVKARQFAGPGVWPCAAEAIELV
ncbi:hypothetical protein FO440_01320 [Mucilaginibacter corticis]|uniref:Uncharacterized protein n=1 Tax=Mucilaginibacter corticis TaxID=2597670 RepID=A0A556MSI2_9SPHI|nr:hypothetical protein [Mucilaginibacter corticis]TSJ42856.1 hypothetical protein FO440_01320 [Mucilaginibacter corticis]